MPNDTKPWYKSLTVWAVLAGILIEAFQRTVAEVAPSFLVQAAPWITAVLALLGRARATQPLTLR